MFSGDEKNIEDIFLKIKYDGPSFNGVMNIQDLGNELIGLEYCLKEILIRLIEDYSKIKEPALSNFDIDLIDIVAEGFVDNCFLKVIRAKINFVEKNPVIAGIVILIIQQGFSTYGQTQVAQLNSNTEIIKIALKKDEVPVEVVGHIKNSSLSDSAKNIAISLINNKKYRENQAKIIKPLKGKEEALEISSSEFEDAINIDYSNKDILLYEVSQEKDNEEIGKFETVNGRIHYINLEAGKNHIGFKENAEGISIRCHLSGDLNVNNYKNFLGEWVEIQGVFKRGAKPEIDVEKIQRIQAPLNKVEQGNLGL